MLNIDFKNWNSLRDFIESKENVHIDLMTHIDFLVLRAKEILKNELEVGSVVITKDNIHLYYEFMSDEDLEKYDHLLNAIFTSRTYEIMKQLDYEKSLDLKPYNFVYSKSSNINKFDAFRIKDALKPIDEYIAEIKASKEYQDYATNSLSIEEKRAYRTGEIPNSPNYKKQCAINRLRG